MAAAAAWEAIDDDFATAAEAPAVAGFLRMLNRSDKQARSAFASVRTSRLYVVAQDMIMVRHKLYFVPVFL